MMLKKIIVYVSLVCGSVFADAGTGAGEEKMAGEFFSQIDLSLPSMANVKDAYETGDYNKAFELYKDNFIDRAVTINVGSVPGQRLWSYTKADDLLYGWVATGHSGDQGNLITRYNIGKSGSVQWHKMPEDGYDAVLKDISTMYWANSLSAAYLEKKRPEYLKSWIGYWADYAVNFQASYDECVKKINSGQIKLSSGSIDDSINSQFYLGARAENFFKYFVACCKISPDFAKRIIEGRDLAKILMRFSSFELPRSFGLLDKTQSSNEFILCAQGAIMGALVMSDFKDADVWRDTAVEHIKSYLDSSGYLADGSDKEQSFNYNTSLIDSCNTILQLADAGAMSVQFKDWIEDIKTKRAYRSRFLTSLIMPDGRMPSVGCEGNFDGMLDKAAVPEGSFSYAKKMYPNMLRMQGFEFAGTPEYALKDAINNNIWGDGKRPAPVFTSVCYPYGGYIVSRSGWRNDALYSFMKTSRFAAQGYAREGANGLSINAYGRYLLVNSSDKPNLNEQLWSDYFNATVSQNSVSVDGFSQARGKFMKIQPQYDKPIDALWHSSEDFDFSEGTFSDGYGGWNFVTGTRGGENDYIKDVSHKRQVLMLKKYGIWVVVDTLSCEQPHRFTMSWNFAPHFMDKEVVLDAANNAVITEKADDVNLGLYFAAAENLTVIKNFGVRTDKTAIGWVAAYADGCGQPFVPVANIGVDWNSTVPQSMVTLIAVSPDGAKLVKQLTKFGGCDMEAALNDGTKITIHASPQRSVFKQGGYDVNAQLFVAVEKDGVVKGVGIDCDNLAFDGKKITTAGCFEFKKDSDSLAAVADIKVPQTFKWIIVDGNLMPQYHD